MAKVIARRRTAMIGKLRIFQPSRTVPMARLRCMWEQQTMTCPSFLELKQGPGEMTLDRVTRISLPSAMTVFAIAIAQAQATTVHAGRESCLLTRTVYFGPICQTRLPTQRDTVGNLLKDCPRADQWAGAGGLVRRLWRPIHASTGQIMVQMTCGFPTVAFTASGSTKLLQSSNQARRRLAK